MNENNAQMYFEDTIVIDNILSDNSEDIITIYSKNPHSKYLDKSNSYKVSQNGEVVINSLNESFFKKGSSKESLIEELINYGFEKIPDNLTRLQLEDILEHSMTNILKDINFAKTEAYSVNVDDNGDLEIILLIYNGNSINLTMGLFPLKLKDAAGTVILADFIDFNLEVSPYKIGICLLKISKEVLKSKEMDLATWSITYEV